MNRQICHKEAQKAQMHSFKNLTTPERISHAKAQSCKSAAAFLRISLRLFSFAPLREIRCRTQHVSQFRRIYVNTIMRYCVIAA